MLNTPAIQGDETVNTQKPHSFRQSLSDGICVCGKVMNWFRANITNDKVHIMNARNFLPRINFLNSLLQPTFKLLDNALWLKIPCAVLAKNRPKIRHTVFFTEMNFHVSSLIPVYSFSNF